jgi:hypothetical protein
VPKQQFPGFLKLTQYFGSPEGAGWSETYYFNTPANVTTQALATNMANTRCFYLGSACTLNYTRVKDLGARRKVELFGTGRAGQWNDTAGVAIADSPNAVILMPYMSSAGTKRNVQVGGVPDSALLRDADDPTFHLHPTSAKYLGSWYEFLIKAPYILQIKERLVTGNSAPIVIQSIGVHTNGRYKITTVDAFPGTTGDQVSFTGLKGGINLSGLQGIRKIIDVIDDSTFTVDRGPRQDLGPPVYLGGGQASLVAYVMTNASYTEQPYVVSTRNRGKVFTRRRGRRSNKQK